MRKTLTLTVDEDMAQFIENQQGMIDPTALINRLFHEDMRRNHFQPSPDCKTRLHDEVIETLEFSMDEDTHAAE